MIEHALYLASHGFAVFPLNGKLPLTRNGFKDATRDPSVIQAFWAQSPNANIGIATGAASGVLVLDVDGPEGEASLSALGPLPETLEARTGKGRHLYFQHVPGVTIGASRLGSHLDHRGDKGYVVAPPSLHANGNRYEWVRVLAPAPLPDHVAARLLDTKRLSPSISTDVLSPNGVLPVLSPIADVDSARSSLSLLEHVQALTVAKPGTKHATLVAASWAHACAAHEAGEPRFGASPEGGAYGRVTRLLCDGLAMNVLSKVEDWNGVQAAIRSAFDRAYARPLPPKLQTYELEFNEDGLARRFARVYGPAAGGSARALYVPGQGWRVWDGKRWAEQQGNGRPFELVSEMLISLQAKLSKDGDEKLADVIKSKKTSGTMGSILTLAQRYLSVSFDRFDADPLLLNCQNGIVDLRTGEFHAHTPAALQSRITGVAYDNDMPCDGWLQALGMMQNNDPEALEYMRILFGSFIQGSPIDGLWIMHGNGFDGKSTVLQVLHGVLGDYARSINAQAIVVSKNGAKPHTSMMGSLVGARLGTIDEMPADCQLDTGAIKSYFGRLPMRLQTGMGKDFVDARPTAKGLIASNHLPRIDEQDEGTKRRVGVIPFNANLRSRVPKDDTFPLRLISQEGPGILNWLVGGCLRWRRNGEQLPAFARGRLATDELFDDGDHVGKFLEGCIKAEHLWCEASKLYAAYKVFAEAQGDFVCSKRAFGNRVREQGIRPTRLTDPSRTRAYLGVALPAPPPSPPQSSSATNGAWWVCHSRNASPTVRQ